MYKLFNWFYRWQGWTFDDRISHEEYKRAVVVAFPHTSNWDFVYAMGAFKYFQTRMRFTIKKEWMRFPLNLIMEPMGAIGIDRRPKTGTNKRESMVDAMIRLFSEYDDLCMAFTVEGTRKKVPKWKTGFYHVAKGAQVPLALGYCDYEKKVMGIGKIMHTTDNMEKDMQEIMDFYRGMKGKHPDQHCLDPRYDVQSTIEN